MKSHAEIRRQVLEQVLDATERQLGECEALLGETSSILPAAKSPRERTAMNIVLDDQRKAIKALRRLTADLTEVLEL